MTTCECITFIPHRVDGLDNVERVTIFADRIVFDLGESFHTLDFRRIGQPVESPWIRTMNRMKRRPNIYFIGEREFNLPSDRFIRFFGEPSITLYMPSDEPLKYLESNFFRVQQIWRSGHFDTIDLA